MKKKYRLTRGEDFTRIRKEGIYRSNHLFRLYASPNGLSYVRAGFSVNRRVGKAVVRNRVKRLMRESFRRNILLFEKGWDFVILAKPPAAFADFYQVEKAICDLCAGMGKDNFSH